MYKKDTSKILNSSRGNICSIQWYDECEFISCFSIKQNIIAKIYNKIKKIIESIGRIL